MVVAGVAGAMAVTGTAVALVLPIGPRVLQAVPAAAPAADRQIGAVDRSEQRPAAPTPTTGANTTASASPKARPTPSATASASPKARPASSATATKSSATSTKKSPAAAPGPARSATPTPRTSAKSAAPAPRTATSAPGQRTITAYITGYSYWDNTPAGSSTVSNPVVHSKAGGTGTYSDPITVAVGHSLASGTDVLDWPAGTRFYVPNLHRYGIVEDTCGDGSAPQNGACHTGYPSGTSTWLDVYVGGATVSSDRSLACTNTITGAAKVIVNPGPGYAVDAGPLSDGSCRAYGDAVS